MVEDARELLRQGRNAEAETAARADHAADPAAVEPQVLLGLACARLGKLHEGRTLLEAALATGDCTAAHWDVLAVVRSEMLDHSAAAAAWTRASALDPAAAKYALGAATAWLKAGEPDNALGPAAQAIELDDCSAAHQAFVEAVIGASRFPRGLRPMVRRAIAGSWGHLSRLQAVALQIVRTEKRRPAEDDLLWELLSSTSLKDPELELSLTETRRELLLSGEAPQPLTAALAEQCRINEFAWFVTPGETAALDALKLRAGADHMLVRLYEAPPQGEPVEPVPVLTPVRGAVSAAVQDQYEVNPYPRWVRLTEHSPCPLNTFLEATLGPGAAGPVPGAAAPDVLVAGCGTGQQSIQLARRISGASVLAVDLSRASLAYATRKARELGVANVTHGQADILELGALGRTFDLIACSGVLHHMQEPAAGLRVLTSLLRPGGLMSLGLYSRIARQELESAKALARGFDPSPAGLRALRRSILTAPAGDPLRGALGFGDFYTLSSCRDLLMHVQEHQFDVGDLRRLLDDEGLRFLGFHLPEAVKAAYRHAFPGDPRGTRLETWGAFEAANPRTFAGMYQFWVQKDS